ncbi:hypothetical protein [Microbulbifer sp. PAAF003]|uniref:hypothetical protein n=1 Tax=Microbulbifer sp. PAAF003 TaxID=3243375 RepID=UPI0040391C1A
MKKGLHISKGFNVNLENVAVWIIEENSIQLQMTGMQELALIDIHLELPDTNPIDRQYGHVVPVNEFKRIEREISEYMSKP